MSLNDYRDEAGEFLRMIRATEEPVEKILGWLQEKLDMLRESLNDKPKLAHQIYDLMFLLFELAARHGLDMDEQWANGRRHKQEKYGPKDRPAIAVRTCRPEDLSAIKPLYGLLREHSQGNPVAAMAAEDEQLDQRIGELFIVAETEGRFVGFAIGAAGPVDGVGRAMAEDAFPDEGPYLEVQDLFVQPEWRNRGVGSALVQELLSRGRRAGMKRAIVYSSNMDYARIGRFYERFGFVNWHLFMMRPPKILPDFS